MTMPKYPSEIFGYPYYNRNEEAEKARENYWCPFVDQECYKQSRLVEIPFGVCSAHFNGEDVAVCPRRFLDKNRIFGDIALHHFGSVNNILVFSEVHLRKTGSFDFVMLKHAPLSIEIEDFIVIEFQTGQTTGTGKLVQGFKDFLKGESISYETYGFGLNLYDIWKRTFTQVLNKGIILENWGHKIFWVVQEPVYRYFEERYNLRTIGFGKEHSTNFAVYNLVGQEKRFELVASRMTSASIDQLFNAFRNNPDIPSKDEFIGVLQSKIDAEMHLKLDLHRAGERRSLDIKPPTSTGRLRDRQAEQPSLFDDID
jgi:hypothetical protein